MAESISILNAGQRVALVRNLVTEFVEKSDFSIIALDAIRVQISNKNFSDYLVIDFDQVLFPEATDAADLVERINSLINLRQTTFGSGDGDTGLFCLIEAPAIGEVLSWDGERWINSPGSSALTRGEVLKLISLRA